MNDTAWQSLQTGLSLIDQEQFESAILKLKEAIEIDPEDSASAHHYLGVAYANLDQKDLAMAAWIEVTRIAPYSNIAALSHDALAVALTHLGRIADAIEQGRKAVEISPGDATMHVNLSTALMRAGRTGEGVSEMEEAVLNDPESEELREMLKQAYDKLLHDARIKPIPVPLEVVMGVVEEFSKDFYRVNVSRNPNWDLLGTKLEVIRLVSIASRSQIKKNGQKVGGVVGGVLGLFGGPLLAAGGAALGAKFVGSISDDSTKWQALMLKIETMQTYINHMKDEHINDTLHPMPQTKLPRQSW